VQPFRLFRDVVRAQEILRILVRYGFSGLLQQIDTPRNWIGKVVPIADMRLTIWQRLRMACEEMGPTFIKMAQVLSTRPDLLPEPLIDEFTHLRDQVKPETWEVIQEVLMDEWGPDWICLFDAFCEQPMGSGSIAQVHRARLKEDGREVAVKIQRPGIEVRIRSDLEILSWLSKELHQRVETVRPWHFPEMVDVLKKSIRLELDFSQEAGNAQLFNARKVMPDVFAPAVVEAMSSRRILVSEFVEGCPPNKWKGTPEQGARLAALGAESIFNQIFLQGFFHADPHPGNVLITADLRICLIDWGMIGQLTRKMRYSLADLLRAIHDMDPEKVTRVALTLNRKQRWIDSQRMEMQVRQVLDRYAEGFTISRFGRIMVDLIYVFGNNGIDLARDYTLLAKATLSIDQTAHLLNPDFNLASVGAPVIEKLNWERWNPDTLARQAFYFVKESLLRITEIPQDFQRVLRRLEDGEIRINLEHKHLEESALQLGSAMNRLVIAVIVGALIVGSSMVITTGVKPLLWGYPALGLVGYLLSAFLGVIIIIDILRKGR
jgi:ubiquinone biosynthesis protein